MERPRIVERATEYCAETKRKIGAYLLAELERLDDALCVDLGTDDEEPEIPDHIILGEE